MQRIDDKFNKLNNNLERYQESMNPAKLQLRSDLHSRKSRRGEDDIKVLSTGSINGIASITSNHRDMILNSSRPGNTVISEVQTFKSRD